MERRRYISILRAERAGDASNVAEARNVQIIVESHSEHLMRRLQRRVAEEEASSEDVKLYFVSTRKQGAGFRSVPE